MLVCKPIQIEKEESNLKESSPLQVFLGKYFQINTIFIDFICKAEITTETDEKCRIQISSAQNIRG